MALDFFSGCVGGAAGVIVGHPLDTVKVRLQIQSTDNIKYRGTLDCLRTTIKHESVRGLYKGISSPLVGVAGVNALVFGVYGALRPYVHGEPGNNALWAHFVAGSISGAVQSFVASPMELVKTRMQLSDSSPLKKTQSPWTVLRQIYHYEGGLFRGVFKGWGVTIVREIPGFGTYFATYEALTTKCGHDVGTFGMMMAGGMAGVMSWIVTFPIDVVKTRLQSDVSGKYSGAIDCMKKTLATEGYKAFSRGLASTVIRAFPTNAATFTVVTWIMRWADERQGETRNSDGENYLQEIMAESARIQENAENSIKLPHYYGYISLSSCCAALATKYGQSTSKYMNFYELIQSVSLSDPTKTPPTKTEGGNGGGLIREKMLEAFNNEKRNNSISRDNLHGTLLCNNNSSNNSSSSSSNNLINNSEKVETRVNFPAKQNADGQNEANIRREKELSHGTSPLPPTKPNTFLHFTQVTQSDPPVSHTNQDLNTLSKILDIPVHILHAASSLKEDENHEKEQKSKNIPTRTNSNHQNAKIMQRSEANDKIVTGEGSSSPSTSTASSRVLNFASIVKGFFENILPRIRLCSCMDDNNCVCFS